MASASNFSSFFPLISAQSMSNLKSFKHWAEISGKKGRKIGCGGHFENHFENKRPLKVIHFDKKISCCFMVKAKKNPISANWQPTGRLGYCSHQGGIKFKPELRVHDKHYGVMKVDHFVVEKR